MLGIWSGVGGQTLFVTMCVGVRFGFTVVNHGGVVMRGCGLCGAVWVHDWCGMVGLACAVAGHARFGA